MEITLLPNLRHRRFKMKDTSTVESLAGRVALITGGTKGIGRAAAIALARAGAQVIVTYMADRGTADSLVREIGLDKALAVKSDASSMHDIESLVKTTVENYGCIDILIANAGVSPSKVVQSRILRPSPLPFSLAPSLSLSLPPLLPFSRQRI